MTATILLTGFGPFPGAPHNPTGPLVRELAHRRAPSLHNIRRVAHVFHTSYAAVDRELPALLARERPHALVMFGLASGTRHFRIETRARNALTGACRTRRRSRSGRVRACAERARRDTNAALTD
jgi:pyroglutamyl-peptidase